MATTKAFTAILLTCYLNVSFLLNKTPNQHRYRHIIPLWTVIDPAETVGVVDRSWSVFFQEKYMSLYLLGIKVTPSAAP